MTNAKSVTASTSQQLYPHQDQTLSTHPSWAQERDNPGGVHLALPPADNLSKLAEAQPNEDILAIQKSLQELRAGAILDRTVVVDGKMVLLLVDGLLAALANPAATAKAREELEGYIENHPARDQPVSGAQDTQAGL